MNNQLLKKVVTSNNESCPPFTYKNPLLDRSVASAVSKSFVKMLSLSRQNSNINNNLRLSVLENIRKICQVEPEKHAKVDENFTDLLTKFYEIQLEDSSNSDVDATDKQLDAYLVRKTKEIDSTSTFGAKLHPETLQALINLNEKVYLDKLLNDVIHWNAKDEMFTTLLRDLWSKCNRTEHLKDSVFDDISIKMKPEIEELLLETCHKVLLNKDDDNKDYFIPSNQSLMDLVKSCSNSKDCFQMCCGILNSLLFETSFEQNILKLIATFVNRVKINCSQLSYSVLYPVHLSSTVVALDFAINELPTGLKEPYIKFTLSFLHKIHAKTESDFVMMLSHFPQWFDIYFAQEN